MFSKKPKASNAMKLIFGLFIAISALVTGCDTLQDDSLTSQKKVDWRKDAIYMKPDGSAVIDLRSRITSAQNVQISITAQPKYGKLTSIGQDLVEYTPDDTTTVNSDLFTIAAFDADNTVIDKDTVVIIISEDTTSYPCGVYAMVDFVYNVSGATVIDVLGNDVLCTDTAQLQLTVPETFPDTDVHLPYFGTAVVTNGNQIVYTPGPNFKGADKFIYRIEGTPIGKGATTYSYGFVYIVATNCADSISLGDDYFSFALDSVQPFDTLLLQTHINDQFCTVAGNNYEFGLVTFPNGTLTYGPDYNFYYVFPPGIGPGYVDRFKYHVCIDGTCKEAEVTITAR
jgi:hypothetical protein